MKSGKEENEEYRVSKKIKTFNKAAENNFNYQEKFTKKKKIKHKEVLKQEFVLPDRTDNNERDTSNHQKKKKKKERQDTRDDNLVSNIIQDRTNKFDDSKKPKKKDKKENANDFVSKKKETSINVGDVFNYFEKSIKHVNADAPKRKKEGKQANNEEILVPTIIQDQFHKFRHSKKLKKNHLEKKLSIQNVNKIFLKTDLKTIEKVNGSPSDQTSCPDILLKKKTKTKDIRGNEVNSIHNNSRLHAEFSKENIKIKSNTLADDLSPTSKSLEESIKKFNKKRKRNSESTDYLASRTEDILHRSKKIKSNPNKNSSTNCINEAPSTTLENKYKQKVRQIKEASIDENFANKSFEDRLSLSSDFLKNDVREENVNGRIADNPGRDSPLDGLFNKLIKTRTKLFNEKCGERENDHQKNIATKVHKISTAIEETFSPRRKKNGDVQAEKKSAITDTIITEGDNKDKPKTTKKMRENITKSNNNTVDVENVKQESYSDDGDEESDHSGDYVNGIKLSTLQLDSLSGLTVRLPFEPHPVHMIETKLTNRPNLSQREEMKDLGYEVLNKLYNKQEDRTIRCNWKEFCEKHILDEDPGPFLVPNKYFPHTEKKKFVQYLARGLPHRSLASVYKRFRLLFTPHLKKGKFSEEEDNIIFECIDKVELEGFTKKTARVFALLSKVLKRDRLQIEKHYIILCKEKNSQFIYKDCDKLIKTLLRVLDKENVKDLANCEITLSDWKKIEKLVDHPYNLLKTFWLNTLYPKLFFHGDRECFSIRKDITQILQEEKVSDWKVVDWEKISKKFQGHTPEAIYKSYKQFVYSTVPKSKWDDLEACITYLTQNYFNKTPKKRRFLKRISEDDHGVFKIRKNKQPLLKAPSS